MLRKSVQWSDIFNSKIVDEGPFGNFHQIDGLGQIFVGQYDLKQAELWGKESICNLVSMSEEDGSTQCWAIVSFQSARRNIEN